MTLRSETLSIVAGLAMVAGCGNTGVGGGATTAQPPAGCTSDPSGINFDASVSGRSLPDRFVPAPGDHPPPCAGTWLTSQRLDLSAWGVAFPGQVDKRVSVCVAGGTWVGRLKPGILNPDLSCGRGPDSPDVTVRFSLTYGGDFDRADPNQPPEACMVQSGITVNTFTVTGQANLDMAIENQVRSDLFAAVDREAADQINRRLPLGGVTSGQALPDDRSGRCNDWREVALPLP